MNAGKVEQVGTPFEIYNTPTTEFVASFVGQLNLIPVEIINAAEKLVRLDGHTVQVGRLTDPMISQKPRLAVRPEELNPGRFQGHNNLRGKVESVNYLGSIVRIRIDMSGQLVSMDMFNERNLTIPKVGDFYDLHFPVDACWLI